MIFSKTTQKNRLKPLKDNSSIHHYSTVVRLSMKKKKTRLDRSSELEIYLEIGGFSSFQWLIWGHIFVRQVYTFFHPDELGPDDDDDAVDDEGTAGVAAAAAHVTAAAVALTVPIFNERDKNTNCKIIAWSPLTLTPVYF